MMRIYKILMAVLLFSTSQIFGQTDGRLYLQNNGIKEKVQSLSMTSYSYSGDPQTLVDSIKKNMQISTPESIRTFDRNGNLIEYKGFDMDTQLTTRTIYKYNSDGDILAEINFDADGGMNSKQTYEYSETGKSVKEQYYNGDDNLIAFYTSQYGSHGKLIRRKQHQPNGAVDWTKAYTYDSMGNQISFMEMDENGNTIYESKTTHQYDNSGKLKTSVLQIMSGAQTGRLMTSYDTEGRKIEEAVFSDQNEKLASRQYHYNADGLLEEESTMMPDGSMEERVVQKYDDHGNPTDTFVYAGKDNLKRKSTYAYTYDNLGNWFLKLERTDSGDYFVVQRDLKYYDR